LTSRACERVDFAVTPADLGRIDSGEVGGLSGMWLSGRDPQIVAIGTTNPATGDRVRKIDPLLSGASGSPPVTT